MKMNQNLGGGYASPAVEKLDVKIEKGFAASEFGLPGMNENEAEI